MSDNLESKIKLLEEKVRLLEIENQDLAERAEDIFLFASTTESIQQSRDERHIYETALEKISITKNIPYCAFGYLDDKTVRIEYEYALFSEEENVINISISSELKSLLRKKQTIIESVSPEDSKVNIKILNGSFSPASYFIVLFTDCQNRDGIFLCLANESPDKLDSIKGTLLHSVTLVNSRLENLFLQKKLEEQNKNLEIKVAERTRELEQRNIELAISEEKYKTLADYTYDWEYWLDEEGNYKYISPAFDRITGYSRKELIADPKLLMKIIDARYIDKLKKHFTQLRDKKPVPFIFQFKIFTKSGEPKWLEHRCVPVYDKNGNFIGRRGTNRDITERKEAEEKLYKFKLGIEQSSEIFFLTNVEGIITYVNPTFERIYGYNKSEALGSTPRILKSGYLSKEFYRNFWNTILAKRTINGELVNKTKEGKLITIEASANPILDENKNIIGFFGIQRDITERKKEELELVRAKEKAENADKLKSIFLAQMSHEIRTPINAMLSLSSLLKDDLEDKVDAESRLSFELVQKAGMRIIRTIDLLLNMSEIQAGTYEPIMERLDLYADILGKIIVDYKNRSKNAGVQLGILVEAKNTEIVADSYTVEQIFTQLVDNSVKYTHEGKITVRVFRNKEKKLVVEITDTGIGIAKEYLPELFSPFTQEDSGYTRKYEGNGIGLALVKEYCMLNKLTIEVESEKGAGSTFRVIF